MAVTLPRGRPPKQPSLLDLLSQTILAQQSEAKASAQVNLAACASDPVKFLLDYFVWKDDEKPTAYQKEILASLPEKKRIAVHSGHGVGKTALASWIILWHSLVSEALESDWKLVSTAGTWSQLSRYLWPEVHRWARQLRWDKLGRPPFSPQTELLGLSLKLQFGEAFALTSNRAEFVEGAHARRLAYVFDESKAIDEAIFDSAEGALSSGGAQVAYAVALSTPGTPSGRFYDICRKKAGYQDWRVRHITLQEAMAAGRITEQDRQNRERQWGKDNPLYRNRIEGVFCEDSAEGVLPLSWVEAAQRRWQEWNERRQQESPVVQTPQNAEQPILGCDIARQGEDRTALAFRQGPIVEWVNQLPRMDTMQTTGEIVQVLQRHPSILACVDVVGIGAGVYDRLVEQQFDTEPFGAAEAPPGTDSSGQVHFLNKRAWAWWTVRELLDPSREGGSQIALPPDDDLLVDLTSVRWKLTSSGKVQIEGKDDVRARIKRSTDKGDATVMALVADAIASEVQFF